MASRMKKMFHRKKDENAEEPQRRTRTPANASSEPGMRTSLYDSTTAGGLPQTGDYPIKGNDSAVMLQAGRKSSIKSLRSRRSTSRSSQYNTPYQAPPPNQYDGSRSTPRMSPPPQSNDTGLGPYDPYQDSPYSNRGQDDGRRRWSRTPLPQEFAGLNLSDSHSPTTTTSTVTTTTRTPHQAPFANRARAHAPPVQNNDARFNAFPPENTFQESRGARGGAQAHEHGAQNTNGVRTANPRESQQSPASHSYSTLKAKPNQYMVPAGQEEGAQARGYGAQNTDSIRTTNLREHQLPSAPPSYSPPKPRLNDYVPPNGQEDYAANLGRQKSIPRKQVGTTAQTPYVSTQSPSHPSSHMTHSRQQSASKALPSPPVSPIDGYEPHKPAAPPQSPSVLDRSRPISRGINGPRDAQDVVNRAKSNTYDTEVVERIAPAVVHENVTRDVHHIREEVITREVHNHEYYHRILPVVDVEVLPPRHFLPVEGGGLVEVSASEVPGRGHNWVIAETASKIASDQAAPQGRRRFTARDFPGREGDAVRYMTPEGHEKTEETWVHPPELEEGARLTGQSWPMIFEDDAGMQEARGAPTSKATSRKSPKKGPAVQASLAQRAGGVGRPV